MLQGKRIALCATRRAKEAAQLLQKLGAEAFVEDFVTMAYRPEEELLVGLKKALELRPSVFVFTTGEGTSRIFEVAEKHGLGKALRGLLSEGKVFSRGYKTRAELIKAGVKGFLSFEDTQSILKKLESLGPKLVFIQLYGEDVPELSDYPHIQFIPLQPYIYSLDKEKGKTFLQKLLSGFYHGLLFTSAYQVSYLFLLAKEPGLHRELSKTLSRKVITVAVGRTTARRLFEHGVLRVYYPERERLSLAIREFEGAFENG